MHKRTQLKKTLSEHGREKGLQLLELDMRTPHPLLLQTK